MIKRGAELLAAKESCQECFYMMITVSYCLTNQMILSEQIRT